MLKSGLLKDIEYGLFPAVLTNQQGKVESQVCKQMRQLR